MTLIPYLIIIGSFIILLIYWKTEEYDSLKGVILFLIFVTLMYLRTLTGIRSYLFVKETLPTAILFTGLFTAILVVLAFKLKQRTVPNRYFIVLFLLYLPMGLVQQLFFQHVFLDTIYSLVPNIFVAVIIGSIFFKLFHLKDRFGKLAYLTFFGNLIFSTVYLLYGNIITLSISHAIIGVFYYSWINKGDAISSRLKHRIKWLKIEKKK